MNLYNLARPFLHALDAEAAHRLTVTGLSLAPPLPHRPDDKRLAVKAFGLAFPNPLGLAAGFDKHAEVPDALLRLGFGFVEVGGVTPLAQAGNPRPRVFRLSADGAIINRYGLNSEGAEAVARRLEARRGRPGIVGLNLGANKDSADRVQDYVTLVRRFAGLASFLTINVSSPNTPGLRDLQGEAFLDDLLARSVEARDGMIAQAGMRTPLLLKIAPDLALDGLDAIVAVARRRGVDGMIVSNTTIARPETLKDKATAKETGGLSGKPLFAASTRMLAHTHLRAEGAFPLIGVGGIDSAEAAWTKIEAGATLLQLYTALVYRGPALIGEIKSGLLQRIGQRRLDSIEPVIGVRAKELATA